MPLFPPPLPSPFILAREESIFVATGGATALVAGAAWYSAVTLLAPTTFSQMRTLFSGTPSGNIDMGIYDATAANGLPGNLLGHTGAQAAVTGLYTKSLIANLFLPAGQYWLGLVDTVADTIVGRGITTGVAPVVRSTATGLTVLPATAGTVANNNLLFYYIALPLNGWS